MNPQIAAAQSLVHQLKASGMSLSQIGKAVGRSARYISFADKGQKGGNLVPALTQLVGGATEAKVARKQTKTGGKAEVRRGIRQEPGGDNISYRTKTGDKTIIKFLKQGKTKIVKWKLQFGTLITMSPDDSRKSGKGEIKDGWANGGSSPRRPWTCDKLLDRIQNPQLGDNWQPGQARIAMAELIMRENGDKYTGYKVINEVQMYTMD